MNISQLRETITELLSASPNLIGTYTLPNASTLPAVYVVGRQSVPSEWKVKGLEVTIEEFASVSPRAMVGKVQNNKQWTVVLIDYTTNSSALTQAAERMARRFPDAQFSFRPETDVVYGQYRIRIPDTELLNVYPRS
jgi:ribonucleotide monophosphatase NagD (HAD superfamily)